MYHCDMQLYGTLTQPGQPGRLQDLQLVSWLSDTCVTLLNPSGLRPPAGHKPCQWNTDGEVRHRVRDPPCGILGRLLQLLQLLRQGADALKVQPLLVQQLRQLRTLLISLCACSSARSLCKQGARAQCWAAAYSGHSPISAMCWCWSMV